MMNEELVLIGINRELIDCMERIRSLTGDKAKRVYEMLDKVTDFINDIDEWISVEDDLPKEYGEVLCYKESGSIAQLVYNPKYKLFNVSLDNVDCAINVTHWQPLLHEPLSKKGELK